MYFWFCCFSPSLLYKCAERATPSKRCPSHAAQVRINISAVNRNEECAFENSCLRNTAHKWLRIISQGCGKRTPTAKAMQPLLQYYTTFKQFWMTVLKLEKIIFSVFHSFLRSKMYKINIVGIANVNKLEIVVNQKVVPIKLKFVRVHWIKTDVSANYFEFIFNLF